MDDATKVADKFGDDGLPYYVNPMGTMIGPEFANVQPEITPRALYKQVIFKPIYDELKDKLKEQGVAPMTMARIFNKTLSDAFNRHIKYPVLAEMLGGDPDSYDEKVINKLTKSKEYKAETEQLIYNILTNEGDLTSFRNEVEGYLSKIIDEYLEE